MFQMWQWVVDLVVIFKENETGLSHSVSVNCRRRLISVCRGTSRAGVLLLNVGVWPRSCRYRLYLSLCWRMTGGRCEFFSFPVRGKTL